MEFVISDPNNKYYSKALNKEINADKRSIQDPQWPPDIDLHPKILSYYNKMTVGSDSNSEFEWYKIFSDKSYQMCLTLGSQSGRHERYLLHKKIVKRFDSIVLSPPQNNSLAKEIDINFIEGDLNFIQLPKDKYDFIFCNGVLHHIINLEHLLSEINKSLTKNGLFVCNEFVGENKWQWTDEKLNKINTIISENYGDAVKFTEYSKPDIKFMNSRPLESIRSQDIPKLLNHFFTTDFLILCDYVLYPAINFMNFKGGLRDYFLDSDMRLNDFLDLLIELDYQIFVEGLNHYKPNLLRGVFRKKQRVDEEFITPPIWSKKEIKKQLFSEYDQVTAKMFRKINKLLKFDFLL